MATTSFLTLPPEIHVSIAEQCGNNDLINLCLTAKWVNETYLRVLYRYVDQLARYGYGHRMFQSLMKRQQQFVRTLLCHPEYGKHVRALKGKLGTPRVEEYHGLGEDMISEEELWRAMQSLTHVQSVDIACKEQTALQVQAPTINFPTDLFQSATSIRLVGEMPYGLAKSILNAINPASLKHLCLIEVREENMLRRGRKSGDRDEDGRIIAFGAMSGLLTPLTGRCTTLRTLKLQRRGQVEDDGCWHAAAEDASYIEWALFIQSVQGTLENFTFEQAADQCHPFFFGRVSRVVTSFSIMHARFQRLVLPAIVSGTWPCLLRMEIRGVLQVTKPLMELKAALGGNAKIVVEWS